MDISVFAIFYRKLLLLFLMGGGGQGVGLPVDWGEKNEEFLCIICLMERTSQKQFVTQKEISKEKQNRKELVKTIGSFFWSLFSCIQSKYRKIRTRKNSVFEQFSRSVQVINKKIRKIKNLKNTKHKFDEKESLAFT